MKTIKISLLFLIGGFSGAVSGQVGVNTTAPNATLDVIGKADNTSTVDGVIAPRLNGTQLKNKDNLYNAAQDGTIVYVTQPLTSSTTSARTRNILVKGYYNFDSSKGINGEWVRMFYNPPQVLAGAVSGNAHQGAAVTVSSTNSNTGVGNLESRTFTVNERSLVTFTISVPVVNVLNASGSNLTDGASKAYGTNLFLTGGSYNNYLLTRQGASFTNSGNFYTTGVFQVGAARSLILDPGTYTANLSVFVFARDSTGVRASFGTETDTVFDIIAYPFTN